MNIKIILSLVLVVLLIGQSNAQGNKNRNKKDKCHLRYAEVCINYIQKLGKQKDPTSIIATSKGLDKICSAVKEDTIKCIKAYAKRCTTPLHRELLDLVLGQIISRTNKFCAIDNPDRSEFLKESPCMHTKVLSQEEYKKSCNNDFMLAVDRLDHLDEVLEDNIGTTHERMCCGYQTWRKCTKDLIKDKCGKNAVKYYDVFLGSMSGTLSAMACPKEMFPPDSELCKRFKAVPGAKAKGKFGDTALTKYITSIFSFMFIVDETETKDN